MALAAASLRLAPRGLLQALPSLWVASSRALSRSAFRSQLDEDQRSMLGATADAEEKYLTRLGKLFDLTGSAAFVTGAASGVGAAVAHGLARFGADVAIADLDAAGLQRTRASIQEVTGRDALALECDVRDKAAVQAAVEKSADRFGGLGILVANAAIMGKLEAPEKLSEETFDTVIATNVKGVLYSAQAVYPFLKQRGRGKIIIMSGFAGIRGFGPQLAYSASKGAVLPLSKSLAVAWGRDNIQVNCLVPGAINTHMLNQTINSKARVEYLLGRIPTGRLGVANDLVGPALFLASPASDYVTGEAILVDGGGAAMPMVGQQQASDYTK